MKETQLSFLEAAEKKRVVNVASVPQRSPFRYPGGKTWLVPIIRRWLRNLTQKPREFFEPFAGGGIVALTVACEALAEHVTMVELDEDVASVWQVILNGDAEWLAERIVEFEISVESVKAELAREPRNLREKAFQTILKNRVYHGGILAPGSGLTKNGENGKGIRSRWYPQTLQKRILNIAVHRERIRFTQGDGLTCISANADRKDAVFFIDPPYTAAGKMAGKRLYKYNELDHCRLFSLTRKISGEFIMTYDNADGVRELARRHGFAVTEIPMKNTHHATMFELLISKEKLQI